MENFLNLFWESRKQDKKSKTVESGYPMHPYEYEMITLDIPETDDDEDPCLPRNLPTVNIDTLANRPKPIDVALLRNRSTLEVIVKHNYSTSHAIFLSKIFLRIPLIGSFNYRLVSVPTT